MGFNEMTHAFLAARYYIRLTEQFGTGDGRPLSMGSSIMEARGGRRMAQRAIRDGNP